MEAERISSDHKVKGVDPAKIVYHQDGQVCFLMPVSGSVCVCFRRWTKHLNAGPASGDAACTAAASADCARTN
jgi:hypothetical protein